MSLKAKIEAVIYASEEPVTLLQLAGLLGEEADSELRALDAMQGQLPLGEESIASAGKEANVAGSDRVDEPHDVAVTEPSPAEESTERPDRDSAHDSTAPSDDPSSVDPSASDPVEHATADARALRERERQVREHLRRTTDALIRDYADSDRGIEIREVAGGFRMGTKPEYHDAVRGFVKSLKPALKLTLQALETLAVVAYKQPVTAAEISEIRGVDSAGVLGGLIGRKLIATAGRKQVIGRPMLYKTTREFLVRFGLRDVHELPSMEEFERLAGELNEQEDLPMEATEAIIERANARGDADHLREVNGEGTTVDPDADQAADPQGLRTPVAPTPQQTADNGNSTASGNSIATELAHAMPNATDANETDANETRASEPSAASATNDESNEQ